MYSQHFLIAIAISSTGTDTEEDKITEFAAKVVLPSCLEDEKFETSLTFHSMVENIQEDVKFNKRDSKTKPDPDFSTVFSNFLDWVQFVIREARRKTDTYLITALVGHFALWKIYPLILPNVHNSSTKDIDDRISLWCQLADSGEYFCKLKRMELWECNVKTTLNDIYKHLFDQNIPGNSSLQAAEALAQILEFPAIRLQLQYMDLLTYQAYKLWYEREKLTKKYFDDLMTKLGPDLVYIEILQRLASRKISYHDIQTIFWNSRNSTVFRINTKAKFALDLSREDANELYKGCKAVSKSCDCCLNFVNRKLWKRGNSGETK